MKKNRCLTSLICIIATTCFLYGTELIRNGDFKNGADGWQIYQGVIQRSGTTAELKTRQNYVLASYDSDIRNIREQIKSSVLSCTFTVRGENAPNFGVILYHYDAKKNEIKGSIHQVVWAKPLTARSQDIHAVVPGNLLMKNDGQTAYLRALFYCTDIKSNPAGQIYLEKASITISDDTAVKTGSAAMKENHMRGAVTNKFWGTQFPVGFYLYMYNWVQNTNSAANDMDRAIDEMAGMGFNTMYVAGASDREAWDHLLERCLKLHMTVVPQLDFAYLATTSKVPDLAARAIPFIKKYKDHPAIAAFSVKEEPTIAHMPLLKEYYERILREVPDAPMHMLHNYLAPMQQQEPPYARITGTDRYCFWWEFGPSGNRASPQSALRWYHTQLDAYYQLAAKQGVEFQAVFTANTIEWFRSPERVRTYFYPDSITEKQRQSIFDITKKFADEKNQGWTWISDDIMHCWKYYRPPVNCVRAMAWLAVMEGARSVLCWSWAPVPDDMRGFGHRSTNASQKKEYIDSTRGWDDKVEWYLSEYAEFARDVQRYNLLLRTMDKDIAPVVGSPLGHEVVETEKPKDPIFAVGNADAVFRSFTVPGYEGRVIIAVNTAVGSWCDDRSPAYLSANDVYRIDARGSAIDFTPFTGERTLTCRILKDVLNVVDVRSGTELTRTGDGSISLAAVPGGMCILFLSPDISKEWPRFKKEFGL